MTLPPIRFGLIGYGLFGAHHARAIAAAPGAELRAIAVPSERSQAAAHEAYPTATIYADYRELLARDDIDAVNVVVPNRWHYEVGRAVLASERHLLLEKPMALALGECDELVALAARHDLVLAIGHELRVSSLWGGVKQLIQSGAIGRPRAALVELSRFPYRQGSGSWRYDRERVGSWILEEPIHFFDLARWYMSPCGDPMTIYARATARDPVRAELHDHFTATIGFADGAHAVVVQTLSAFGHHQTVKVSGTDGTIWAQWSAADARAPRPVFSLRYGLGESIQEPTFDKPTGELLELADEVAAFAQAIQTGQTPPCTGEDGRWSTLLCLAAEESVRRQQELSLKEFAVANRPPEGGPLRQDLS
ncbi:MAG TPA: Gfo/Idh/MocA family oxidoreductase [Pirellulaceae bacterium]|nr:Gfo/Idh/MocA family oxidoreductase [Pirellulaceae bacterium]